MKRLVYFISDSTGITAETMGKGLLAQFSGLQFEFRTLRYIDNLDKVDKVCAEINQQSLSNRPIVISTLVQGPLRAKLESANADVLDLMGPFLTPLEEILGKQATFSLGLTHGQNRHDDYEHRMGAVNFALNNDDGLGIEHYQQADVILIGPSRAGKTPTCLYLAMQYGVFAANYPLVDEDLETGRLPQALKQSKPKLFGLTIRPERLSEIRQARRPDSGYASLEQCKHEVRMIDQLLDEYRIPGCDVTLLSIEEIATRVLSHINVLP